MTLGEMLTAVHDVIGQTGVSSPYVNDAMITEWLCEGKDIMCRFGKVYSGEGTITVQTYASYSVGTMTVDGDTCTVHEIIGVVRDDGYSLQRIRPTEYGKEFGDRVGTVLPLWYFTFANYVWLYPQPAYGSPATYTVNAYVISPDLAVAADTPKWAQEYHYGLVCYAIYKAKQAIQRYDEASVSLQQFFEILKIGYEQRTANLRGFTRGADIYSALKGQALQ